MDAVWKEKKTTSIIYGTACISFSNVIPMNELVKESGPSGKAKVTCMLYIHTTCYIHVHVVASQNVPMVHCWTTTYFVKFSYISSTELPLMHSPVCSLHFKNNFFWLFLQSVYVWRSTPNSSTTFCGCCWKGGKNKEILFKEQCIQ